MATKTKKIEYPDEKYVHKSEDKELKIFREQHSVSPRSWDNYGVMVCSHRRMNLGDREPHSDSHKGWSGVKKEIKERHDVVMIKPLYLYNHSGVSVSTTPFNSNWDSSQVGFIFITEDRLDELGLSEEKRTQEQFEKIIEGEVETYDQYLNNQVFRYEYWVDGEQVDSCGGFFGEDREQMFDHITGEKSEFEEVEVNESDY